MPGKGIAKYGRCSVLLVERLLHDERHLEPHAVLVDAPAADASRHLRDLELGDVRVIGGIELSTRWNERNVHVLGYLIRTDDDALRAEIVRMRRNRFERGSRMVEKLCDLGYEVSMDDVLVEAGDARLIARPHIA